MKKLLAVLGFLLALAGAGVDFQHGDSRVSLWNHTLRHWNLVESAHLFKQSCAAGLVPSGGGPCGGAGSYTLTGATNIPFDSSTTYTVQPNGASSVTVTPADASHGGLFNPATVSFTGDTSPQTFTYTPLQTGSFNLSTTNSGALTNPSPLALTISNSAPGYPSFASGWTTSATGTTATQGDPFGGTAAVKLTETTASNYHFYQASGLTFVSGQTYTVAVMVKEASGTRTMGVSLYNSTSSAGGGATVDPVACTASNVGGFGGTTASNATASSTGLAAGYCLLVMKVVPNFTSGSMFLFMQNGTTQNYVGDGTSAIDIYGPVIE